MTMFASVWLSIHGFLYLVDHNFTKRARNTDINRAVAQVIHNALIQIRQETAHDPVRWVFYIHVGA